LHRMEWVLCLHHHHHDGDDDDDDEDRCLISLGKHGGGAIPIKNSLLVRRSKNTTYRLGCVFVCAGLLMLLCLLALLRACVRACAC
jgi:hypothetical protein